MIKLEIGDRFIDPDGDWNEVFGEIKDGGEQGYLCVYSDTKEKLTESVNKLRELNLPPYEINDTTGELEDNEGILTLFLLETSIDEWEKEGKIVKIMRKKIKNWKEVLTNEHS